MVLCADVVMDIQEMNVNSGHALLFPELFQEFVEEKDFALQLVCAIVRILITMNLGVRLIIGLISRIASPIVVLMLLIVFIIFVVLGYYFSVKKVEALERVDTLLEEQKIAKK